MAHTGTCHHRGGFNLPQLGVRGQSTCLNHGRVPHVHPVGQIRKQKPAVLASDNTYLQTIRRAGDVHREERGDESHQSSSFYLLIRGMTVISFRPFIPERTTHVCTCALKRVSARFPSRNRQPWKTRGWMRSWLHGCSFQAYCPPHHS